MDKLKRKIALARQFRRAMTPPEYLLWERLKARLDGLTFRRQHPLGPYVLDFYCAKAKLAVEVDGALHGMGDRPQRDAVRDQWLGTKGVLVYRLPAADVFRNADEAADGIRLLATERLKSK